MPTNLIRSLTFSVIVLAITFAFAFAGVGVSQLFFRHQADGSITAAGSTLSRAPTRQLCLPWAAR
jgi:K+-transporting ATPase c subunit